MITMKTKNGIHTVTVDGEEFKFKAFRQAWAFAYQAHLMSNYCH